MLTGTGELCYEYDDPTKPVDCKADLVRFNGMLDGGHETFYFCKKVSDEYELSSAENGLCFSFCKTARKPYDRYVTACLMLAKFYFKDDIIISSDGDIEDWQEGIELIQEKLNVALEINKEEDGRFEVTKKASKASNLADLPTLAPLPTN